MANTIRIKRRPSSGSAGAPSSASLYNGELAFNENDNTLYYAYGSGVGGISTAVPAIAGSGAYALRGGTNATGTWPISINGNAAYATNAVYTTGNQNISGNKTFLGTGNFDSSFRASLVGESSYNVIFSPTQIFIGQGDIDVKLAGNAYYDPNGEYGATKEIANKAYVTSALSGVTFTAGSGLVNGGTLVANRTFDVGQGDGITVSADSIAVDSTVVRTTGNQSIGGTKTISDSLKIDVDGNMLFEGADDESNPVNLVLNGPQGIISSGMTVFMPSDSGVLAVDKRNMIAGSGLIGGGDLSANRTFDINTGDGIQIVSDAVAVNSTVVRTTGTQTIAGVKTISDRPILNSGLSVLMASTASSGLFFPLFTSDPSSAAQALSHRTPSQVKGDIGLGNVTNDAQIKKLASTSGGYVPTWNGTTGDALNIGYGVETTLTGGTSSLPRADAVKTYVDNAIISGISTNDAMIFKGAIDCSTNPNYPAADRGWTYKVSVAGKIGGASGTTVEVNDTLICTTDGTAAGTQAAVGSNWIILQTNITDASILVTGPTSATSGNFVMFDGTTGKIIKDSSFGPSSFATASHTHGNITNAGAIGSTANLPIITTTAGALTTGSFGSGVNTFCQGNDSRLSDTRNTTQSLTVNNGGGGTASSFTFNGGTAQTISYNSIGAPSISGTNATGTWNISVTGNAGTVTSGIYTYGSYADPSWITSLAKSKVGLSNVENTALSTWAGSTNLTTLGAVVSGTWNATTIAVDKGGTGQTSYTNGQLLIGNTTGNTLTKATLTQGTAIDITNGGGSITIGHNDTSTLTGAQGSNGIASFTVDGMGHVTAVTTATYLTAGTVCAAIVDCSLDGGTF
jgi:hypothetical protein